MSHRNARLTVHGRRLLGSSGSRPGHAGRACRQGDGCFASVRASVGRSIRCRGRRRVVRPVVAAAPDADADRRRGRSSGDGGSDRASSGPGLARTRARGAGPHGEPDPAPPPRPRLAMCDPMTGEVIRASKTTAVRYERDRPGELVHMDVKKIGRIPDGGGWRAHGREMGSTSAPKNADRSATTSSTRSSTTTAASRTRRSSLMKGRHHRRVLRPCSRAVRPPTASADRRGHDRQPLELHAQQELATMPRRTPASNTS